MIELLVTLSVMALLLGLAAPSFYEVSLSSKLSSNANRLVASAAMARSEAIKRNAVTQLCISTDHVTCAGTGSWESGWVVLTGTTVLHYEQPAPAGYKIKEAGSVNTMSFQPSGVGSTAATFTVCRATPTVGAQERQVAVTATGRATVTRPASVSTCS